MIYIDFSKKEYFKKLKKEMGITKTKEEIIAKHPSVVK